MGISRVLTGQNNLYPKQKGDETYAETRAVLMISQDRLSAETSPCRSRNLVSLIPRDIPLLGPIAAGRHPKPPNFVYSSIT